MADDDKGTGHPPPVESVKSEPHESGVPKTDHPSEEQPSPALASPSSPSPPKPSSPGPLSSGPMSEWTASDRRGPMEHAQESEIERFVPAHELDAEGGLDRPADFSSTPHAPHVSETPIDEASGNDSAEPVQSSHEPVAAAPAPERRRSFVPVAAGLVVGAIIGAGSAWLVYSQGQGSDEPQKVAALSARVEALEKRPAAPAGGADIGKLQASVTDLQGKVAALGKTASPASSSSTAPATGPEAGSTAAQSDAALGAKVAALGTAVAALQAKGGATASGGQAGSEQNKAEQTRLATVQSGLADARKQASDAQAGLDAVKTGQKQLDDKVAALAAAVTGAQKQAQGAQAGLDGVQKSQAALEGKLGSPALAVVADSLAQQIAAGQPYGRQVDALASLGADPAKVAVLREGSAQGVPSAPTLAVRWKPLVEPVIATGNKAPANADFGQRLQHGLFGLVSVRRADGTVGDDLASRVDQIAADLAANDVPGAYKAWQALPPDAKARSADWGAQAKTSAEALAAARGLQQQAIDALGAKKS